MMQVPVLKVDRKRDIMNAFVTTVMDYKQVLTKKWNNTKADLIYHWNAIKIIICLSFD